LRYDAKVARLILQPEQSEPMEASLVYFYDSDAHKLIVQVRAEIRQERRKTRANRDETASTAAPLSDKWKKNPSNTSSKAITVCQSPC
jgi:hypothetical protein